MSRFDMYKPDNQERLRKSPSPFSRRLDKNTPSSNIMQIPNISLIYYKKLIKSKKSLKYSSKLAFKDNSMQRLNLTGIEDDSLRYKSLFSLLKSDDSMNKIKTEMIVKKKAEELGLNRKSTTKLLSKLNNSFENTKSESPLPKINKNFQPLKPKFKKIPCTKQRPPKKDPKVSLNKEKICAWETDSNN